MISDPLFFPSLLQSLLYLQLFLFALFIAFYIPGKIVTGKTGEPLGGFGDGILCLTIGMVLWAYQGMLFGYMGLRFLSFVYLMFFVLLWLRGRGKKYWKKNKRINRGINRVLLLLFALGIFGQTQQFFIAGMTLSDGIRIFTGASDDAFWHTALNAQIVRYFPPFEPGLVNIVVKNYHYLANVVMAELVRVFHLPLLQTQFQYVYIFISFLLGAMSYTLAKFFKFSFLGIFLLIYFQYFASDIIYLVPLFTHGSIDFSIHPLESGTMFLENPPRAFAAVVLLCGILLTAQWLKDKKYRTSFLASAVLGSAIGFKVHAGIPVVGGLACLSLYLLLKKQWRMLLMPLLTAMISFTLYMSVNSNAGLPIFAPFEMSRMFTVQPGLHISHLELARRVYGDSHNIVGQWRMDILMFVIFMLAQFGIKNIGFIPLKTIYKQFGIALTIFFYASIGVGLSFGTFFYQPVAGADIFNFYLTAALFLSILSAYILSQWLTSRGFAIQVIFIISLLFLTAPRWIYLTQSFREYFRRGSPTIAKEELHAMDFVRTHTDVHDTILVFNQGQWDSLYPYVSIFTQRDMFLSGQGILGRHGISYQKREDVVASLLGEKDGKKAYKTLKENSIQTLYFYGKSKVAFDLQKMPFTKIFDNGSITVYSLNKLL